MGQEVDAAQAHSAARLHPAVRDTLAAVRDDDVPAVVARWAQAEELYAARPDDLRPVAEDIIQLARRARGAGEQLYCWTCL